MDDESFSKDPNPLPRHPGSHNIFDVWAEKTIAKDGEFWRGCGIADKNCGPNTKRKKQSDDDDA